MAPASPRSQQRAAVRVVPALRLMFIVLPIATLGFNLASLNTLLPTDSAATPGCATLDARVPAATVTVALKSAPPTKNNDTLMPPPTGQIVVAGVGRSGTTYMTHLLSALDPNAFVLLEPFHNAQERSEMGLPELYYPSPSLEALLACTYARSQADVNNVLWSFACKHSTTFNSPTLFPKCKSRGISPVLFNKLCRKSQLRIAKVLRLPWLAKSSPSETSILPPDALVVQMVRHPASILQSAARLGWYTDQSIPVESPNQLFDAFFTPISKAVNDICTEMLANLGIADSHDPARVLIVKLEDLATNLSDTMAPVLTAIGRSSLAESERLEIAARTPVADLPKFFDMEVFTRIGFGSATCSSLRALLFRFCQVLTDDQARAVVRMDPVCRHVLKRLNYE
eukprot:m.302956 g.302956  ORF g.302956 m.302956 type:complete len:398 (+) comp55241_c0_seq2:1383-2576(+)